ncbi:MAG TPA: DUF3857 domain-containing transglutaminase family protein [Polyangia bacterium]|nr:DUF3857 domain-containing transglutaminase family protein [Polyangia bacterium]
MRYRRLSVVLCAWTLGLCAAPAGAAPRGYTVAPEPSWVEQVAPPSTEARATDIALLLSDEQRYIDGNDQRLYRRSVMQIRSSEGLHDLSHLRVELRPAFERLTLHTLRVVRNGVVRDALETSTVDVSHDESELDAAMLDGSSTAVIVVDDLRVGDVLDWSYSIDGANPVLGGHISSGTDLALRRRVGRLHRRLVIADRRPVRFKSHGAVAIASERDHGGVREYVWDARDVAGIAVEDEIPDWFEPSPWLQMSDFASWNEVARWASALFPSEPKLSPELSGQIARWRQLPTERERVEAALTFVRRSVRYFGLELGSNSHQPHAPSQVFAQRFGDCKDKAYLLVTILRALGVEAWPALTDTRSRRALDDDLPGLVFDHVIVAVMLAGQRRWVDPTAAAQLGTLDELTPPPFERALIIDGKTTALAEIAQPALEAPDVIVDEHYWVAEEGSVRLDVTTTRLGAAAESFRSSREAESLMAKEWLGYYSTYHPSLEQVAAPSIEDGGAHIVVSEHYRMPLASLVAEHERYADVVSAELHEPSIKQRTMPLAVHFPMRVEQRVRLEVPGVRADYSEVNASDDVLQFHRDGHREGHATIVRFRLRSVRDSVAVADVARHLASVREMQQAIYYGLQTVPSNEKEDLAILAVVGGLFGLALGWLIVGRLRARLRKRRQRKRTEHGTGESAATAIAVADEAALTRQLQRQRCACAASFTEPATRETVRFAERDVTVVRLVCASCAKARRVYFVLARQAA